MKSKSYDIGIIGAGIAGLSTAYMLSVIYKIKNILVIDELAPLSLTSDKSTECYRNWWPGPDDSMIRLMNHSISWLELLARKSDNRFNLNRRGYLYATDDVDHIDQFFQDAEVPSRLGAGDLRIHGNASTDSYIPALDGKWEDQPDGADLITNTTIIKEYFPYLTQNTCGILHVRKAGWFSAQQLGMYLLEEAQQSGVEYYRARVDHFDTHKNSIQSITCSNGTKISLKVVINATGPLIKQVSKLVGIDLPVHCELHQKNAFEDCFSIIPRNAPLLIWNDPQYLYWTKDEKEEISSDNSLGWLLNKLPNGVHTRPEGAHGSHTILTLWEYKKNIIEPTFPITYEQFYPEIVLRGLIKMIPGLSVYLDKPQRSHIDGGYYTRTPENRPIISPTPIDGFYIIGAFSGFGLMASLGAADLISRQILNIHAPDFAKKFLLERYNKPDYLDQIMTWENTGQL